MKLPVISYKKDEKYIIVVPKIATAFINDNPLLEIEIDDTEYKEIENRIREFNEKTLENPVNKLFIINTLQCDGRCLYCYDKNFRNENVYLSVEQLDKAIKKNNIEKIDNVIFYGGEPVKDFDNLSELIFYLKEIHKTKNIHIVTSLFYDDNTFLKLINLCENENISLTISIDPPSEKYPRIYKDFTYKDILNRVFVLANSTSIIFGVRSTISNWAFDGVQLFKDLNKISENKPISVNFDLIKGYPIDYEILNKFLKSWIGYGEKVIQRLLGKTYGTIFHPTFNKLLNGGLLLNILKNCDAGRGRIAITPTGETTLCNEDVIAKNFKGKTYDVIFPFDDECKSCPFQYSCGYHCFTIDKRFRKNYCYFHTELFKYSMKYFINLMDWDFLKQWIKNQYIQLKKIGG